MIFKRSMLFRALSLILMVTVLPACSEGKTTTTELGNPNSTVQTSTIPNGTETQTAPNPPITQNQTAPNPPITQNQTTPNPPITTSTAATSTYQDSFVSFQYPQRLRLDQTDTTVTAQFFAPETNSLGGVDNCTLSIGYQPGETLQDQEKALLATLNSLPAPDVSYWDIGGQNALRVNGDLTVRGVTIYVKSQTMYKDDYAHFIFCFGIPDDELQIIFDSFRLNS